MKFREAVTRAGTFYLAKGQNGAIYGALTFVNIQNYPGQNHFGPGETMIFSVTNMKIFNYEGYRKPIFTSFGQYFSNIGFSDSYWRLSYIAILFRIDDNTRLCESY
jgi:hypothetical protein